jgi:hypothetical protein
MIQRSGCLGRHVAAELLQIGTLGGNDLIELRAGAHVREHKGDSEYDHRYRYTQGQKLTHGETQPVSVYSQCIIGVYCHRGENQFENPDIPGYEKVLKQVPDQLAP